MKNERGFTLLELVVVLSLIVLILGMSAFFVAERIGPSHFDAFVRDVTLTLRQAKTMAIERGEPASVVIDLDSKHYGIAECKLRDVPEGIGLKIVDINAREVTQGKYRFVFYKDGIPEKGSIIIWNEKRKTEVRTNPLTGFDINKG